MRRVFVFGFVFLLFLVVGVPSVLGQVSDDNLVWAYNFEGNANDLSGNGHHGTVTSATNTSGILSSSAYQFTSSTHRITVNDSSSTRLNVQQGSISSWVYPYSCGGYSVGRWLDKSTGTAGQNGYNLRVFDCSGSTMDIGVAMNGTTVLTTAGSRPLNNGTWNHVVVRWNGSHKELWVNGDNVLNSTNDNVPPDVSGDVTIGSYTVDNDRVWNGRIDALYAWSRYITDDDISSLYSEGDGLQHPFCSDTVPTNDMSISSNTVLCPGTYNFASGIKASASNIVVTCNETRFIGSNSGTGFDFNWQNNVTLQGCYFENYDTGAYMTGVNNNKILDNTFINSTSFNVRILGGHTNLVEGNFINGTRITNGTGTYADYFETSADGVLLSNDAYNTIVRNNTITTVRYGIRCPSGGCNNNDILYNHISNIGKNGYGVLLDTASHHINISFNTLIDAGWDAVQARANHTYICDNYVEGLIHHGLETFRSDQYSFTEYQVNNTFCRNIINETDTWDDPDWQVIPYCIYIQNAQDFKIYDNICYNSAIASEGNPLYTKNNEWYNNTVRDSPSIGILAGSPGTYYNNTVVNTTSWAHNTVIADIYSRADWRNNSIHTPLTLRDNDVSTIWTFPGGINVSIENEDVFTLVVDATGYPNVSFSGSGFDVRMDNRQLFLKAVTSKLWNVSYSNGTAIVSDQETYDFNVANSQYYDVVLFVDERDVEPPTFTNIPSNATIEYGVTWLGVDFNATDNVAIHQWYVNDTTNFAINGSGYLTWTGQLGVNEYHVLVSVNDTSGNENTTIYNLNITTNTDTCDVYFNETSPLTYPATFTVWTDCTIGYNLTRNGTNIMNNSLQELSAGSYNFSVQRSNPQYFLHTYDEANFIIQQSTPTLSVSGTTPITDAQPADVTGTGCPSQLTCTLYRNGSPVSNPDTTTLSAGTYNYEYNTSGNENYTTDTDTFTLTVTVVPIQTFKAYTKITEEELNNFNVTINGTTKTNSENWELSTGTYNATFSKTNWYNQTTQINVTTNSATHNFTDVYNHVLTLTASKFIYDDSTPHNPNSYQTPNNAFDKDTTTSASKPGTEIARQSTHNFGTIFSEKNVDSVRIRHIIAGHGVGVPLATINIQKYDGSTWTTITSLTHTPAEIQDETITVNDTIQGLRVQVIYPDWPHVVYQTSNYHYVYLLEPIYGDSISNFTGYIENTEYSYIENYEATGTTHTLNTLANLTYDVYLTATNYTTNHEDNTRTTLTVGEQSTLHFILLEEGTVYLRAMDTITSETLNNVTVRIYKAGEQVEYTFDEELFLTNLTLGQYELVATKPDYSTFFATFTLSAGTAITQNIYMSSDYLDVNILVRNQFGQFLEGASVTITRDYDGVTIGTKTTDFSGATFFSLARNLNYNVVVSHLGYQTFEGLFAPLTDTYTITLDFDEDDINSPHIGVSYSFTPNLTTILTPNTTYNFTFNINSTYWDMETCTFQVYGVSNWSSTLLNTSTGWCDANTTSISANTSDYERITALTTITNSEGVSVAYRAYYEVKEDVDWKYSIKNAMGILGDFQGGGFNDFSRMLLTILIIIGIIISAAGKADFVGEPERAILLLWGLVTLASLANLLTLTFIETAFLAQYLLLIIVSMFSVGGLIIHWRLNL